MPRRVSPRKRKKRVETFIRRTRATFGPAVHVANNAWLVWGLAGAGPRRPKVPRFASREPWYRPARSAVVGQAKLEKFLRAQRKAYYRSKNRAARAARRAMNAKVPYFEKQNPFQAARRESRQVLRDFLKNEGGYLNTKVAAQLAKQIAEQIIRGPLMNFPFMVMPSGLMPGQSPCLGNCGPFNMVSIGGSCALACGNRFVVTTNQMIIPPGFTGTIFRYQLDDQTFAGQPFPILREGIPPPATGPYDASVFNARSYGIPETTLGPALRPGASTLPVMPKVRAIPFLRAANFEGWPQGYEGGYDPAPAPGDDPPIFNGGNGRGIAVAVAPSPPPVEGPPNANTREAKPKGSLREVAHKALSGVSESRDIIEALFGALPRSARRGISRTDTRGQLQALWDNFDKLSLDRATQGLIENYIEDRIVGGLHGHAKRAAKRYGISLETYSMLNSYYDNTAKRVLYPELSRRRERAERERRARRRKEARRRLRREREK